MAHEGNPVAEALVLLGERVFENMTFEKMAEKYLDIEYMASRSKSKLIVPVELRRMALSAIRDEKFGQVNNNLRMEAEDYYGKLFGQ